MYQPLCTDAGTLEKQILVDISNDKFLLSYRQCETAERPALAMPLHPIEKIENARSIDSLADLRHELLEWNPSQCEIVFGIQNDPFYPYEDRFDVALKTLETLVRTQPANLCVQTRSPLVLITLPILRAVRASVSFTLGLEDDSRVLQGYNRLPRLDERERTFATLSQLGFNVRAQGRSSISSSYFKDIPAAA